MKYQIGKGIVEISKGSITRYQADALVCPANGDLEMVAIPGGVQYAFLSDGGEKIFLEARKIRDKLGKSMPEFSAHLTGAGRLPARYVIHSVAVKLESDVGLFCNKDIIAKSTRNVLELGKRHNLRSIGFPTLGTGLYGVPIDDSVDATTEEFSTHLKGDTSIERLGLILYSEESYHIAKEVCDKKFL